MILVGERGTSPSSPFSQADALVGIDLPASNSAAGRNGSCTSVVVGVLEHEA